jgi:hypothetical protein
VQKHLALTKHIYATTAANPRAEADAGAAGDRDREGRWRRGTARPRQARPRRGREGRRQVTHPDIASSAR